MTTTPIRATYAIRPRRRIRARHIAIGLILPPLICLSMGLCIAIIMGLIQGINHH